MGEAELREALEDMCGQFACHGSDEKGRWLYTGGLSALEGAFDALGWDDPHFVDEGGCEIAGCEKWATCVGAYPRSLARSTVDVQMVGFGFLCGDHFRCWNGRDPVSAPDLGRRALDAAGE